MQKGAEAQASRFSGNWKAGRLIEDFHKIFIGNTHDSALSVFFSYNTPMYYRAVKIQESLTAVEKRLSAPASYGHLG